MSSRLEAKKVCKNSLVYEGWVYIRARINYTAFVKTNAKIIELLLREKKQYGSWS